MVINIVVLVITLIASIAFIICLATSGKYAEFIDALDEKEFPIKSIYGVGYCVADLFKLRYTSKLANDLRQQITILYGQKYCEFYIRVLYAQKISICWLVFLAGGIFACFTTGTDSIVIFGVGILLTGAVYTYFNTAMDSKIKKMSNEYMRDFPSVISTLALLVNAGMMLREAWEEVALSSSAPVYLQMQKSLEDMNNGASEAEALYSFSIRCATPEIKKLISLLIQGIDKGNKELSFSLKAQSEELWELKKQNILQQGEIAASRLLIPIMVMFVGVLVIVMGPILTNIGI